MAKQPSDVPKQPDPQTEWWKEERDRQNAMAEQAKLLGITIHIPVDDEEM